MLGSSVCVTGSWLKFFARNYKNKDDTGCFLSCFLSQCQSETLKMFLKVPRYEGPRSAQFGPGVLVVEEDLQQDRHVDQDLRQTTNPELGGALVHQEVGGLEDVAGGPQHHHLHAAETKTDTRELEDRGAWGGG